MKDYKNHEMGCWYFDLKSPDTFTKLEKSIVAYPFYYLYAVYFILKIFREEKLLKPKKIEFNRQGDSSIFVESLNDEQILLSILEEMNREIFSNYFSITGTTYLLIDGELYRPPNYRTKLSE